MVSLSSKHVFWQALLTAILIFGIGILFGFYLESSRNTSVEKTLLYSEVNLLDNQVMGQLGESFNYSCELAEEKLIKFADDIYSDARQLENYDSSAQIIDILEVVHRKYDLLRVMLWSQSIELKKKCGGGIHTAVYIYDYKDTDPVTKSEQITFGRVLEDLKNKYGNDFILIPIAGDLDISSIELIKDSYNIKKLPSVIIDESVVIDKVGDMARIEENFFLNSNKIILN